MKASALVALLLIASPRSAHADTPVAPIAGASLQAHPGEQIESATDVSDPTFSVHARALGLERGVEMLQWRRSDFPAPPHYEQAWTAERIDSNGFDAAHRNPGELPFNGQRWWTSDAQLDGHAVAPDVLAVLDAWVVLKPDLSRLPTNLAVSFQPDGDWLSTSQDPAHPQIGDVRVRWRIIAHASVPSGVELVAGRWELPGSSKPVATKPAVSSKPARAVADRVSDSRRTGWPQWLGGNPVVWLLVGAVAMGSLMLLLFRRRRKPARKRRR